MHLPLGIESVPVFCLTPLYQLQCDAEELAIDDIRVLSHRDSILDLQFDHVLRKHFGVCRPDHFVFNRASLQSDYFRDDRLSSYASAEAGGQMLATSVAPAREFLNTLRLFAPGHLHAGETFVLLPNPGNGWMTIATVRASDMAVDYGNLNERTKTYTLNAADIPAFQEFRSYISPILQKLESYPPAVFALALYSADDGERSNFSSAVTALEALLTKKDEKEGLTYRLSMRLANLLGQSPDARKSRFAEMKKVYNIRSNIVHGSPLVTKSQSNPLDVLPELRETLAKNI